MAKAIMIQGTASNAGKSLIAAGLCRIFSQDGYRVAPFKAQNMALNSFITKEGLEMGRAQVTQAEAAGIEPSVLMNPILLKPTNDSSSQVIVNGEVMEMMSAADYYAHKKEFAKAVKASYDRLAADYDILVLEGAGSPAEINLKEKDIVNMYMAKLAKAPVLLAGDIDRGGVFASLVGTMELLEPEERDLVKAILINKFRGSRAILEPGLRQLERMVQKPVMGVIPYMSLDIDDEDSLTQRFDRKNGAGLVDLAVIRVPRISNFTDFNVFDSMPGVTLRYVDSAVYFGNPDLILLPGTKNTMEDLLWMRQNGIEGHILKHAARGKPVFGICGGYQMLGKRLKDPHGLEHGGEMAGMGLLPFTTIFEKQKRRTRVSGRFEHVEGIFSGLSGVSFEGYEIHMGISDLSRGKVFTRISEGGDPAKEDGMNCGNVYGSYVHGIFDEEQVAGAIISALLRQKGISDADIAPVDRKTYKNQQYDLLAQGIREHIDMELLYKILEQEAE